MIYLSYNRVDINNLAETKNAKVFGRKNQIRVCFVKEAI